MNYDLIIKQNERQLDYISLPTNIKVLSPLTVDFYFVTIHFLNQCLFCLSFFTIQLM